MAYDYDYASISPVDNTGIPSTFKSAYRNIRFALQTKTRYMVTDADTANLVGIAYKLYGDMSLWYAILAFNGLKDPIQDIKPGVILNIPAKADLVAYLSSTQSAQKSMVI